MKIEIRTPLYEYGGYGYVRLDPDALIVRKLRVEDGILKRTEQGGRDFLKALGVPL